ncbi:putative dUTP diphosphatase Dut [Plenodomus tracheiphilus IPT5]|uniref:Putative dUTP diphosphatase Dut n=1 Tax=Plenodomus tracheiphilus IPT5 TaxID=1408161 RepID=A0A6A7BM16_9PLEO|nr:putative dUTP diphosphatase Dut [Plenodomus tracheiphilus IPT5]
MIIPGRVALQRSIITHLRSAPQQVQPCGIDLTLKRVMKWSSGAVIDFDNTHRKTGRTIEMPFHSHPQPQIVAAPTTGSTNQNSTSGAAAQMETPISENYIDLASGSYLVEFNENVDMPLDLMGQILVRSSLFRSGALVHAGVMDSGYKGPIGAMLQVVNPHGIRLLQNAKLAQMVFHQMSEPVEGYSGVYQGRSHV